MASAGQPGIPETPGGEILCPEGMESRESERCTMRKLKPGRLREIRRGANLILDKAAATLKGPIRHQIGHWRDHLGPSGLHRLEL